MIEGIDISSAQPLTIDWNKVKGAGVRFVYVKASEGVDYVDPFFMRHVANAKRAGVVTGAYHFLRVRHGKPQDASQQCDDFCKAYRAAKCEMIPALDCEDEGNAGCTVSEWLDAIREWVDRCKENLGVEPIVYTYPYFWSTLGSAVAKAEDIGRLKLWIANYVTSPAPIIPKPWSDWTMWQDAASAGVIGRVPGVPTIVDRNKLKDEAWSDMMYVVSCPDTLPSSTPDVPTVELAPVLEPDSIVHPDVPLDANVAQFDEAQAKTGPVGLVKSLFSFFKGVKKQ